MFEDLRYSLAEDDYPEGCRCVVRWFARFIQDNSMGVFEDGGMVPEGDQWRQEVAKEVRIDGVYLFPY